MVFTITNQKGGVGKTTSVINIGASLASKGYKTLVIDLDPQANLTSGLNIETNLSKTIYNVLVERININDVILNSKVFDSLYICPSSIELAGAEIEMVSALSRENILKNALKDCINDYDFILIDCPPSLGLLTLNGLVAADRVLIPVQTEYFALEGLSQLINTVNLVKNNLNSNLDIGGVILTMYDSRTNLSKEIKTEIENFFTNKVFKTVIPRNIRLSEAPSYGKSILEYDPNSNGAKAYNGLVDEILEKYNHKEKLLRPNLNNPSRK